MGVWMVGSVMPLFGQVADYYPVPEVVQPFDAGDSQSSQITKPAAGGIQMALVVPEGDMRSSLNGRTGFSVGAHGGVPVGDGLEMRPRFDYTRLDGGSFSANSLDSTLTMEGIGLGADILAYGDKDRTGPYAFAGANLTMWYIKHRFDPDTKGVYPNISAGVGTRFTDSFSADLEFDYGRFRPGVGTLGAMRLVIYYRLAAEGE
jgi:hypothetical protein